VTNPSLTGPKKIPLRKEFPAEVKPTDVLDPAGLQIGFDTSLNVCYAYAESVELAPQESKVFDVKIRNPWADESNRVARLEGRASELLRVSRETQAYKSVEDDIQGILKDLAATKNEKAPAVINEEYVAHERRQAERRRAAEVRIMRVEELFQPHQKPQKLFDSQLLNVRPPDTKTTWVIIYIILGFLGVVSMLFFLRWYGRSRADTSAASATVRASSGSQSTQNREAGPPGAPLGGGSGKA